MPTNPIDAEALLHALRLRGVATARELGQDLKTSQPSISRLLAALDRRVARLGRARATRYAATRNVRGLGSRWPLYRIDAVGRPQACGQLVALHGERCLLETEAMPPWLRGDFADGLFPGLPWFLEDLRPQGYMGRAFGLRYAAELGLRADIQLWNQDEVLTALLLRGDDGPGNFVLGEHALDRALGHPLEAIPARDRAQRYAELATTAQAGELAGSSAAGEQPKFTACVEDTDGALRHVIVKFSGPMDAHPASRRWADLLICEYLAAELLREHGLPAVATTLIRAHDRWCLESTRFDRIGAHGRRGVVSLAAWSDAYDGERDGWPQSAARMRREGWLDDRDPGRIERLWWFGQLIGNTDMHFGNLSFFLDEALPLSLCPSYDMLPMLYRPAANGDLPPRDYLPPPPRPATLTLWQDAAAMAASLWQGVVAHEQVSAEFRRIAAENGAILERWRQRFG